MDAANRDWEVDVREMDGVEAIISLTSQLGEWGRKDLGMEG